jgi:hypothetical protein
MQDEINSEGKKYFPFWLVMLTCTCWVLYRYHPYRPHSFQSYFFFKFFSSSYYLKALVKYVNSLCQDLTVRSTQISSLLLLERCINCQSLTATLISYHHEPQILKMMVLFFSQFFISKTLNSHIWILYIPNITISKFTDHLIHLLFVNKKCRI